jgi:hypothetical protein
VMKGSLMPTNVCIWKHVKLHVQTIWCFIMHTEICFWNAELGGFSTFFVAQLSVCFSICISTYRGLLHQWFLLLKLRPQDAHLILHSKHIKYVLYFFCEIADAFSMYPIPQ